MSADPLTAASTQSDTGIAGGFDNTGSEIDSNFDNASIKVTIPQIIVTKTLVGPAIVPVADFVAYDITVTNIGSTAVPSVPVTDTYDAARLAPTAQNPTANRSGGGILAWNDVTGGEGLAPGNSVTVRATFATLATGASIADTATVAGLTDEDGSPIPSSEATNAELSIGRPELTITKAAGVATAVAGQVVTYTIAITNAGSTPAYHVRLNDTFDPALPPVLDTVTLDGVPAAHNTGIFGDVLYVGFDATPIPAGSTVVVAYHTTAPSGLRDLTELPNNAHVTSYTSVPGGGATYDGPSTDATVTALSPVLEAVKSVEGGTHPVAGEVVHYRLDVTNTGHAPASTLMVSDVLSDGDMNPVAAGTVTWPDASQTTMGGSGVLGLWTIGPVPGTLLPGQTAIVRWDMRVAADATPGAKTDTATASSEDPAGGAVQSNPSPASVLVTRPGLSVHKVLLTPANGHAQLGSTVTYGVTVTNTGDTTLTAVRLSDSYDAARLTFASAGLHTDTASLGTLGWTNVLPLGGTLAPGATTDTLTVSFTANSTGTAVNTATVSGATDLWGHVPADAIDRNEELTVTRPHVAVTKELSSGQEHYVPRGQIVSYDITVTNDGDTSLVTLPLTDTYDASRMVPVSAVPATDAAGAGALSWTDLLSGGPALAPGDHRSVTVTFRTIASGSLVDTAAVIGATDTWGGTAPDASARNAVATGTNPRVDLSKVLAPGQSRLVAVGDTVTYAFRVTNTGDTTLTTVPLSDAYQASQMAFVSATPDGATAAAGLVSWPDATAGSGLAPGETTTATATFRVLIAAAALDDTATVNGTDVFGMAVLPEGSSNGVAGAYAPGDLTLVKTADPASGSVVATGSLIHYTLTYLNSSPATVTAGVVSDTLVPALIYVPDSIALNGSPVADAAAWDAGSSSLSVALPPVGPGELGTVTFTARVAPWALSRRGILNSASWSDGGSVVATAEPTVHNVDPLDVVKTVRDVSGKGKVRTGDVLEWTIQIVNHGVVPATGVRMTDDVPRGTTYVKGSITGPGASSVGNPHLSWAIGTIAVDGTVTVTFRSKVGSVKSGTRISNQAVAYADQSNPKRSSTAAGTVDDPTTVVVRTSGDELWTLLLVLLLLAFAAGLALPRPKVAWGRRVLRNSAVLLVLAALLSGGLEIAAANGFDVPTPSGVLASIMAPAASRVSVPAKSVKAAATVNRVSIPSIHLDIKLVEGKDMGVLARGLWHQPPSVVPGERGASVIAGHRIAGQFINLHLLHKGDRVTVTYGGRAHVYRVSSVQDVASTSATASFRVGSVEKLILYTCTPRWQGNRRTIVTCLPVK
jgi:LPXTG-site transpeptidase (sortase) family protein